MIKIQGFDCLSESLLNGLNDQRGAKKSKYRVINRMHSNKLYGNELENFCCKDSCIVLGVEKTCC